MKKFTLTIFTTAIALFPLTAFAQDAQTSIQTNGNSAAAVGDANLILQNADQANYQQQLGLDAAGIPATPNAQTAVQQNANEAAAIGGHNVIDQNAAQESVQGQVDVNQYFPQNLQY
jgi:hypothetical protein